MVFKGRFFSSKKSDTSSPDGSYNSPRSSGSSSPIRSDSKKKGKSTSKDNSPSTPTSLSSFASFRDKKKDAKGKESQSSTPIKNLGKPITGEVKEKKEVTDTKEAGATSFPLSPIMASSLGLNKIKTRSGPLPQESFFGYGSREKGNALSASNLSKTGGDGTAISGLGKKSLGKKDEKKSVLGSAENAGRIDNGSNSDGMSAESAALRDRSTHIPGPSRLQSGESSSGAGQFNPSWSHSGGLRGMDGYTPELKESESPRVQAILRVTSAPRKRFPADIKSFSHELNSKGVRPYPFWKPRGLNNLEQVLTMIRAKFDKAKEEVDSDLRIFAADLVGVLEKNAETHPEWQETIEDLLVLARSCAMTSPGEFWLQCEGIVQELDDRRQELPMGTLKQLHTRMLFILTRCTRLLQFHKESAFAEDEPVFQLCQSLRPVEKRIPPGMGRNVMMSGPMQFPKVPAPRKSYSQEQHGLEWKRDQVVHQGESQVVQAENPKKLEVPGGGDRMTSWYPTPAVKNPKEVSPIKEDTIDGNIEPSKLLMNKRGIPDVNLAADKHPELLSAKDSHAHSSIPELLSAKDSHAHSSIPSKHQHKVSWGYWGDQPSVSDENSIICRICEDEVPTLHVEDHSRICAIADRCDQKGLSVNERLLRVADTLEKLMESFSQKDFQPIVGSPDVTKVSNSSVTEGSEPLSPKLSDWSRRGSEDMLHCFPEADNSVFMDEFKGLPTMSCKTRFGPKSDQGMTTSSAGSMTPRSPLQTPRTSQIDLLLAGKGGFSEHDDLPQMNEQADIARCVANTPLNDDRSISYLLSCLEDLKVVTERRKWDALTVETFGTRIEKLIREKYLQLCELVDDDKVDISSTVIEEDAPLEDDVVRSLRTSPIHSKDRTSIDDFEIIKPISRGAFGRVFLAKKKTTGDFFAIKLTDFGLSKVGLINSTDDLSGPAVSGTSMMEDDESQLLAPEHQQERREKRSAVGTPDYLAPEILLGTGHGFTADWWSVGVILFELIVGIPPFNAEHPQKIFDNILNRNIPWPGVPEEMSTEAYDLIDRLLTEDPNQRLGAGGASEVKQHPFFRDINWDTLARQKAAFVPASENALDTSYFMSRFSWNPSDERVYAASEFEDSTDNGSVSDSSSCLSNRYDELVDEWGGLAEFESGSSINYSFSNFSFKNLSQLASINYDLLTKDWKDDQPTNPNA